MTLLFVFFSALVGAACSGLIGMGGGIFMLAMLTFVLPIEALVPVHAMVIMLMIIHRSFLFRKDIEWALVRRCVLGLLTGTYLSGQVYLNIDKHIFMTCLGIVLLALIWLPQLKFRGEKYLFWASFPHGFIATLFGTGGVLQAVFSRSTLPRHKRVGTFAAMMSMLAAMKIAVFWQTGFDFMPYKEFIILAWFGAILGNFAGRYFLGKMPEAIFHALFKWTITLIAVKSLLQGLWGGLNA